MTTPFTIKLEVDGMRHQVVHAFAQHAAELADEIDTAFNEAIEKFDFAQEVRNIVWRELPKLVDGAVTSALRRALYAAGVEQILVDAVVASAKKLNEGEPT